MKRILASLFVIVAIVGIGVFTTGAYFTSTVSTSNQVFTTGTASLKLGLCGKEGAQDCTNTPANLSTFSAFPVQTTGPGVQNSGCLVVENTGDFALTLSTIVTYTTDDGNFPYYFQLAAYQADNWCNATTAILGWTPAVTAAGMGPITFGALAPHQRLYVMLYNRWDSSNFDQSSLQGKSLTLTLTCTGQTV